jgi:hypothetical protein
MSIGSFGFAGIGAATPLVQSKGADADRTVQETTAQKAEANSDLQAERAAGVGQTDGNDHEIEQREADGRLPWKLPVRNKNLSASDSAPKKVPLPSSRDASGQCGNMLDLTG